MKKIFPIFLAAVCVVLLFLTAGCGKKSIDIAFITSVDGENAGDLTVSCFAGMEAYSEENGMTSVKYVGACGEMLNNALSDGAQVIVVFNVDSKGEVYDFAKKHPDIKFICVDFGNDFLVSSNIYCINLAQIDCGVYAGYSAVKEGNLTVGIQGEETAETYNYIRGFMEGAQIAAVEIGVSKNLVKIYYNISGSDMAVQRIVSWYDSGCEMVLCSDDAYKSVSEYITSSDMMLMTFGANRTEENNVSASAFGNYRTVIYRCLKSIFDDGFNGGTMVTVGADENAAGFSYKSEYFEVLSDSDLSVLAKTIAEAGLKDANSYKTPSDKGYSKIVLTETGIITPEENN